MKTKVIATTREYNEAQVNLDEHWSIGGKLAGICYMRDNYLSEAVHNLDSANRRANMTSKRGHHSVFGHSSITMIFEDIPKMIAMVLNSVELYTTSEKSARYTKMKPETELEMNLYNKWCGLFMDKISEVYPQIEDVQVAKLAQENARYLISVFTPTTMAYTTTYCQWNYIVDWADKLIESLKGLTGTFNERLLSGMIELRDAIVENLGEKRITDNKDRYFEFLPLQHGYKYQHVQEQFGDTYQVQYHVSIMALAHLHRHRTLHYEMQFGGRVEDIEGFYIPEILKKDEELKAEWLKDIKSVADVYPQGMMVNVIESGLTKNFFLKCTERMCGRAQLEVTKNTLETLVKIDMNSDSLSVRNRDKLESMLGNGYVPKCGFKNYSCSEGCIWGVNQGLTRKI